jgi:uncharacterized protein (AIM24 family)
LRSSFKNFDLVVLNNDHLILETGVFCAAHGQLTISPKFNLSLKNQLSGLPIMQTHVQGSGHLIISSPGPMQTLELNNDKFIATNGILARSNSLSYTKEPLINNTRLQENTKLAHVFRGTGKILFAPYCNQNVLLTSYIY